MKQITTYMPALTRILTQRHLLACLLLLWLPGQLRAQILDPTFHIPEIYGEGTVADAAQMPNGQYVVGGNFTRVNAQGISNLARFDAAGAADQTFRQNLSGATVRVEKLYPLANGQLLVQGDYAAGAVQRRYLFRLNADGTLDPAFSLTFSGSFPGPDVVQTLVQADGRMLVLGFLTGNANSEIIRLLSDGSRDPSFNVALTFNSNVAQMVLQPDGKLIIGGDVYWVNGVHQGFFSRLNTDGSLDASYQPAAYTNAHLYINSIALDANGSLVVGGLGLNVIAGRPCSLFRMLPTGALDPSFTPPASVTGRDCKQVVVQQNGQIAVLTSSYSTVTQAPVGLSGQLVHLEPNGTLNAAFQPGTGPDGMLNEVRSLANGNLLTWGYINNFSGQRRTVALLQPGGGLDAGFAPLLQLPTQVHKLVRQADGKLIIAGRFNSIDGHLTDRIARLLPNGQPDLTFTWRQPQSNFWYLSALAVQADGQIFVAGMTSEGNNLTFSRVFLRLAANGTPDPGFGPAISASATTSGNITLLDAQANGQVLVGGSFVDAAGKANLTRLNPNGSVDAAFTPSATQTSIQQGVVQANGNVVCIVEAPAPFYQTIVRLLPSGAPDPTFTYTPVAGRDDYITRIAQVPATGDYIVVGVAGNATRVLSRISATGAAVAGFSAPFVPLISPTVPGSGVNVVAAQSNGKLLVGGVNQRIPSTAQSTMLARLEASGPLDGTFSSQLINTTNAPSPTYSSYMVSDILVQPDGAIVVGGYFLAVAGQPVTGLVRLVDGTALAVSAAHGSRAGLQAWPVPAHDVLHLSLTAAAAPQRVSLLNALGQTVLTQPTPPAELTLNTATLARGIYLLRVEYADGPATRRIVVE